MLLKNAEVFDKDFNLIKAEIAVENGLITEIGQGLSASGEVLELEGCIIAPGFVDIHTHGCAGFDACDATPEALSAIAGQLVTKGVTSFCPTTMTIAPEDIEKTLLNIKSCMENPSKGARILGVNMEGPYISVKRKGGQRADFVKSCDFKEFRRYFELSGGIIKIVDIAPETDGADEFMEGAKKLCRVSIAHTEADYETAKAAFKKGVTQVTHLFNAMPGFSHREPGTVGAVFEDESVMAELICDGFHIHPATLRLAFRILGEERSIIVSDSMRAAGLEDGTYELGGQAVNVKNGQARLSDGTIAGSTTNIYDELKNLVSYGVPLRQAVKAATINPARAIGEDNKIGSIEPNKAADFAVLDSALNLRLVISGGKIVFDGAH